MYKHPIIKIDQIHPILTPIQLDLHNHVIMNLLIVQIYLFVLFNDLSEGHIQLLHLVERKDGAHYQLVYMVVVKHLYVGGEDRL